MILHFLHGDLLECPTSDEAELREAVREHLQIRDPSRYTIHFLAHESREDVKHVLVDDIVVVHRFDAVEKFPVHVTAEMPRRTVWINPPVPIPSVDPPLMTHYTEYLQLYLNTSHIHDPPKVYTVRYWRHFEDIEMVHPTETCWARYRYLQDIIPPCPALTSESQSHFVEQERKEQQEQEKQEQKEKQEQEQKE